MTASICFKKYTTWDADLLVFLGIVGPVDGTTNATQNNCNAPAQQVTC